MLNPESNKGLVRESHKYIVPNRKGSFCIYRASGRAPVRRKTFFYPDKIFNYKEKNKELKIYQIFHDEGSFGNCIDTKYVTRLCVNDDFDAEGNDIEYLGPIKYRTNQISETRAFLHATLKQPKHFYIGFTSHRHDFKFFPKDGSCPLGGINYNIVVNAFSFHPWVKMIAFRIHPAYDALPI
jgi:hypothetical protein